MLESPIKVIKEMLSFSFLKAILLFFIIVLLAWAGYNVFRDRVYGDEARELEDFKQRYDQYVSIHKNDTYGGKTPQETLNMFIEALEANDPELATLYFIPDDNGSREEWDVAVKKAYRAGKFPLVVAALKKAKPAERGIIGENFYEFVARDENGKVLIDVHLIFNGNIWKIDSI